MAENEIKIADIRDYFGMSSGEFAKEWRALTAGDKAQIRTGVANGTLTY